VYRFLLTPRWLAAAALTVAASVIMVFLGNWQLHRYHERSAINARIDAADSTPAVPLTSVLARPAATGRPGAAPGKDAAWTKVTVSGRYDPAHEIQARGRTVDGSVGFEIVTPLLLVDGTAVLVDRGWVPSKDGDAISAPAAPPAPAGEVTVVGQVHLSESRPAPLAQRDGRIDTRRIAVPKLAAALPFPVYGAYVLVSDPEPGFEPVGIDHEDSWQNGGYAVQWWVFAVMALLAYGWQARKEAQGDTPKKRVDRVAAVDERMADGWGAPSVPAAADDPADRPSVPSDSAHRAAASSDSAHRAAVPSAPGDLAGPAAVPSTQRAD
jgi:cytochrome oxidase assembly protein ShyY1